CPGPRPAVRRDGQIYPWKPAKFVKAGGQVVTNRATLNVRNRSLDVDPCLRTQPFDHAAQRFWMKRHASGGRSESLARHVDEHSAASARNPRTGVVVEFD